MNEPLYPELEVELSGQDGNAFAIIGRVSRLIRNDVGNEEAEAFTKRAFQSVSYEELLQTVMKYVHVA